LGYNAWTARQLEWLSLELIAFIHMDGAFAILLFLVVHLYMFTTRHSVSTHTKAMITGWEDVEEGTVVASWKKAA
jgi:thiosulfate reductase cytochrome b subunit